MVSVRIQRRIDALLDEADEAVTADDWKTVRQRANAALSFDANNEDAKAYFEAAVKSLDSETADMPASASTATLSPAPAHPSSFVAGRYRVERFLGEGGRKRVFLAHDTTLDRDIAFAQIRTGGLDDFTRERVTREAHSRARTPVPRRLSFAQEASRG